MEPSPKQASMIRTALEMCRPSDKEALPDLVEIATLVRRTLEGDSAAFGEIIVRHERRVLTLSIRLLGSLEDAQDAAQEVFLRAFKYIHRLNLENPIEPWLMRMTVNVCRDIGRNRQRRRTFFVEMAQPEAPAADSSSDPFAGLNDEQQKQMLQIALERLPAKEKMAVVLRDVEGFSTSEVA